MMPDGTPAGKHAAAACAPALSPSSDPLNCNPKATQGQSLSSGQVLPNAPRCAVTAKDHISRKSRPVRLVDAPALSAVNATHHAGCKKHSCVKTPWCNKRRYTALLATKFWNTDSGPAADQLRTSCGPDCCLRTATLSRRGP